MGSEQVDQSVTTPAAADVVYELLRDSATWPQCYALRSGLPVRGYRADVDLEPNGQGTAIRSRSSFDPKWPGTGWLIRRRLSGITDGFVRGLAAHAAAVDEDRSAGPAG
jgi:hypothetical protein